MDLKETYQKLSNQELLRILSESHKYNDSAINTAKEELAKRKINETTLKELKTKVGKNNEVLTNRNRKQKAFDDKTRGLSDFILELLNPIKTKSITGETLIKYIVIVYGIITFISWINEWKIIVDLFTSYQKFDIWVYSYLIGLIIVPISLVLLYRKSRIGWILFTLYLTYSFTKHLKILPIAFNTAYYPDSSLPFFIFFPDFKSLLVSCLFSFATIAVITRLKVLDLFTIKTREAWSIIILSFLVFYYLL